MALLQCAATFRPYYFRKETILKNLLTALFSAHDPVLFLFLLFFFLSALHDLLKKSIPLRVLQFFLLLGIPCFICSRISQNDFRLAACLSFLPGLFLCLISHASDHAIGIGDAYFLLVSGFYLSLPDLILFLLTGIFSAGILSILLLASDALRARRRPAGSRSIPFIPCMLPSVFFLCMRL